MINLATLLIFIYHQFFSYSYMQKFILNFKFKIFLQMSLFIEQANLCLPTTKTTEMIEISIIFIIFRYFWKKYRLFEAETDTNNQKKADTLAHH